MGSYFFMSTKYLLERIVVRSSNRNLENIRKRYPEPTKGTIASSAFARPKMYTIEGTLLELLVRLIFLNIKISLNITTQHLLTVNGFM